MVIRSVSAFVTQPQCYGLMQRADSLGDPDAGKD